MYPSKFSAFNVSEIPYKIINDQPINTYILTPKNLEAGKHPIIVSFHGGFHVTGASLYPDWFSQWLLDYANRSSALLICADYRLLPESNGPEILSDVKDFWSWLPTHLPSHLKKIHPGIKADLERLICFGASAGGHLALLSGLGLAPNGVIKAIIAAYPSVQPRTGEQGKSVLGAPTIPESVLTNYLTNMKPGQIVTSAFPPERMKIALSITQQGRKGEFIGDEEGWWPARILEKAEKMPFTFIMHGTEDSAVSVAGSVAFADRASEKFGEGWGVLVMRPGEHGFDTEVKLEERWLGEGLERVSEKWLKSKVHD